MINKSMKSRFYNPPLVLILLALLLFGCTTAPAASTQGQLFTPAPVVKTFVFGRSTDAINPDPVMCDDNADIWYIQQYYSGLLRFKPDNSVEADLAEKWDVSTDGMTYTFTLRPGSKFADGSAITGADWQWSLDRCRNPENGNWASTMEAVDMVEASDTQVVFKLKYPSVTFIYSTAMFNCVVMPAKQVEAAGGWEKFMEQPVGAGPFLMKEWVRGDHMLLVRNPYYWETGKPILDEILIKTIPDDNTRILALQKGDVDAINFPPPSRYADLSKDPNIKALFLDSTLTYYLILNNRDKPLDDARVRQALAIAIDRDAMIKTINFGVGIPATSLRPKGTLYFNDTLPGWGYDVAKAKSLLAEAGYPDGFELTMEIVTGRELQRSIATLVQAMWAEIGVKLTVNQLEAGLYSDNFYNNNYQVHPGGWSDDNPDPGVHFAYAMDGTNDSQASQTGFMNEEAITLVASLDEETDPSRRQEIFFRLQEIFNEETPFIPLWYQPYVIMTRTNVSNFYQTPLGTYIWRDLDVTR